MCSLYGLDLPDEGDGADAAASSPGGGVRFRSIAPGDEPQHLATLRRWAEGQHGRARITGRIARNLNPVIHVLGSERTIELAWWWLHVEGAPAEYSAFNSRSDRLLQSWREPFRCRGIVPASWYVEKDRRFALPAGEQFGIAAILAPAGPGLLSYSMVTRNAVGQAFETHDRMPLVLPRELHDEWLDPHRAGDESLVRRATAASEEISRDLVMVGAAERRRTPRVPPAEAPQPTLF